MIDAIRIERGCATFDSVDGIALGEQEFRKIGAILPRDPRY
jgi:hypothetical protein